MNVALGMSVGARAVKTARVATRLPESDGPSGWNGRVSIDSDIPDDRSIEQIAAQTVDILLVAEPNVDRVAVSYRTDHQRAVLRAALEAERLGGVRLVHEASATIEWLRSTGELQGHTSVLVYNLGSSGLTVAVADEATGDVSAMASSRDCSGDLFDRMIRDHLHESKSVAVPHSRSESEGLDSSCRIAKERVSTSESAQVTGPLHRGVVSLTRRTFESLIAAPLEASLTLAGEVVSRSGVAPTAVVLVGGCARIPLVQTVLKTGLGLPVITPDEPEFVSTRGAAQLADSIAPAVQVPGVATSGHRSSRGHRRAADRGIAAFYGGHPHPGVGSIAASVVLVVLTMGAVALVTVTSAVTKTSVGGEIVPSNPPTVEIVDPVLPAQEPLVIPTMQAVIPTVPVPPAPIPPGPPVPIPPGPPATTKEAPGVAPTRQPVSEPEETKEPAGAGWLDLEDPAIPGWLDLEPILPGSLELPFPLRN